METINYLNGNQRGAQLGDLQAQLAAALWLVETNKTNENEMDEGADKEMGTKDEDNKEQSNNEDEYN